MKAPAKKPEAEKPQTVDTVNAEYDARVAELLSAGVDAEKLAALEAERAEALGKL